MCGADCCESRSWRNPCFTLMTAQERGLWHFEVMGRSPVSRLRLSPCVSARSSPATWLSSRPVGKRALTEMHTSGRENRAALLDSSYYYTLSGEIDTSVRMMCFLISGESREVSKLEERRALREQLSPRQIDRDQPPGKHASLTDRVGVTQGSSTLRSGCGAFVHVFNSRRLCFHFFCFFYYLAALHKNNWTDFHSTLW